MEKILRKLLALKPEDEAADFKSRHVPFEEAARDRLDEFRQKMRGLEEGSDGRLQGLLGKLPGMAIRIALILAYLDWSIGDKPEPTAITEEAFQRAAFFLEDYALPMARRTYGDAAISPEDRAARRLLRLIRERGWENFSSRDVCRARWLGLARAEEVDPALRLLVETLWIRPAAPKDELHRGRKPRGFDVNPALWSSA